MLRLDDSCPDCGDLCDGYCQQREREEYEDWKADHEDLDMVDLDW